MLSLCRELLRQRLPEVYDGLIAAGVAEASLSSQMPPSLADRAGRPGDEQLTMLMTRRSTLDWVLRRAAVAQPGVTVRGGVRRPGCWPRPGHLRTSPGSGPAPVICAPTWWLTPPGAARPWTAGWRR